MVFGGGTTLFLTVLELELPGGVDPILFGLTASLLSFIGIEKSTALHKTSGKS